MRKHSLSLVIWKMQIKTTHYFTLSRMTYKPKKIGSVSKDVKKLEHTLLIKCKWLHCIEKQFSGSSKQELERGLSS